MEERQVNHMLFMDDLKLFTKPDAQLNNMLRTVHLLPRDALGLTNVQIAH